MAMNAAASPQQSINQQELSALLQRELNQVRNLLHCLEQEYAALAERQTTTLEEVVKNKQKTIGQLEQIGRERDRLLASMNTTIQQQLAEASDPAKGESSLAARWNELVVLAEKCQEMNRINGSIVDLVSRQSRHALDILRGISPQLSSSPELYDRTGYKTISSETHTLTKA